MADVYNYEIVGLRQFQRALKQLGEEFPESLREFNVTAAEKIIAAAKERTHTRQEIKAAESLRAGRAVNAATVRLGDNRRYAFARGAEWGARKYRQFRPWRGNQWRS